MSWLGKLLRHLFVRWLPTLLLLFAIVIGAAFWCLGSKVGTRMLLTTIAAQFDGSAQDVRGTLLGDLHVARLTLRLPGVDIDIGGLHLDVQWKELSRARLHVRDLSAERLAVALTDTGEEPDSAAFGPLVLPLDIAVDRLALGELSFTQDGQPLPVSLSGLQATLAASRAGAQLRIASLHAGNPLGSASFEGDLALARLAAPWPFEARVTAQAGMAAPDSPLCLPRLLRVAPAGGCATRLAARASGSLDGAHVALDGDSSGVTLRAEADLLPLEAFPLRTANAALDLPDGSGLSAKLDWTSLAPVDGHAQDQVAGSVSSRALDLTRLLPDLLPGLPPARLTMQATFDAHLLDKTVLQQAGVTLTIDAYSRWNRQPLSGSARVRVFSDTPGANDPLAGMRIDDLNIDLKLGRNRIKAAGNLGQSASAIALDAQAPQLAAFWPSLQGAAAITGRLAGTLRKHQGELAASYVPADSRAGQIGRSRAEARVSLEGSWGPADTNAAGLTGWRGAISTLSARHAGFDLATARPVDISFVPRAQAPQWQWTVGAATVDLGFPNSQHMTLAHAGSRGAAGRWQSAGHIDNMRITPGLVRSVMTALDPKNANRVDARADTAERQIALDATWNLQFAGALAGGVRIARRSGDLPIPGDPPIPLALRALTLDLSAKPATATTSRVAATLNLASDKMGSIAASAQALLAATPAGGFELSKREPMRASLQADVSDLSWVGLFTGDATQIGGTLKVDLQGQAMPGGEWSSRGTVRGENLRFIRLDDGVRLLDGTLSARLENTTLHLDALRFPASLRVMPTEWRTKTWISEDPDAKAGYIEARGQWNLLSSQGRVTVDVHRYPALQRSDRYAMISGSILIDAALPDLAITGDLKADAGWVSLEILSSVPTLDDDVTVRRPGAAAGQGGSAPLRTSMDLTFDMGPRFYVTGMGLDAGIVGTIQIRRQNGRLTGSGALRTRGGRIEAYGQKLQLRRGTFTFQGPLDNPLLDIEALRTGEQVEAGVKVLGTAQRPRITLVSYPDVDDVEKLSWLILGRAPDQGGGDAALLLSVGTALLGGGGEPFYRSFGLDDVSMRSGTIGSSGSLLPDRTVAGDVNRDSDSTLATQFLVASKKLANGITLSVEQAMAGSETVARASYQLSRRLSVELKGGSVNGLALVYRRFFQD